MSEIQLKNHDVKKQENVTHSRETSKLVNRCRHTDDPYDKLFRKGLAYNYYSYVKEIKGKVLYEVRYGELYQINENYTKEPNRNSITKYTISFLKKKFLDGHNSRLK